MSPIETTLRASHTMNYSDAKQIKAKLESEVERTGATMKTFPKGDMGLTPDNVKSTNEFKTAKREFDIAFANLRNFNGKFVKVFKNEIEEERKARFK